MLELRFDIGAFVINNVTANAVKNTGKTNAEQFVGMDEEEIDGMMQPFAFCQRVVRGELAHVIASRSRKR